MKRNQNTLKLKDKAVLILVLSQFLLFQILVSFSIHVHELPDGRLITHSHLITQNSTGTQESKKNEHSHTELELLVLYLFTSINVVVVALYLFNFCINYAKKHFRVFESRSCFIYPQLQLSLRAPPAL